MCNDLKDSYFDGSDGAAAGFPPSQLIVCAELYQIELIVCPRCKKRSNGVMPCGSGCGCFVDSEMDQMDRMHALSDILPADRMHTLSDILQEFCKT